MAETKKENSLKYLSDAYNEYDIDYRENSVTLSYDFIIDTGSAKIILKIGQKRWDDSNAMSIVEYLKSKEQQISKSLSNNQDAIISMK